MEDQQAMPLDDNVESLESAPIKDNDGIPYCRNHHCRMKQSSGGDKKNPTKYYKCPVPKCKETGQVIKTENPGVVPAKPLACARCSDPKKAVYCERDEITSSSASVILKCPSCGWKSNTMAVPLFAAAHFASRSKPSNQPSVGDR